MIHEDNPAPSPLSIMIEVSHAYFTESSSPADLTVILQPVYGRILQALADADLLSHAGLVAATMDLLGCEA